MIVKVVVLKGPAENRSLKKWSNVIVTQIVPHNVEITIVVLAQYQAKVEYALLGLKKVFNINYQYHLNLILLESLKLNTSFKLKTKRLFYMGGGSWQNAFSTN